uniref:CSON013594 protein n=1 Tax=Culicoides sonorensis TaxID=179676 RepID=A0A336M8N7_CULSO
MKFTKSSLVCLVVSLCIALTSAQFFGGFPRSGNSLAQLTGDFGGPTAFAGIPSGGRDPRENRGNLILH